MCIGKLQSAAFQMLAADPHGPDTKHLPLPCVCQIVICVLHLQRSFVDEGWFSVLVATQQVLLWIKLVGLTATV